MNKKIFITEGLNFHDMEGQVLPLVTVDEYAAKMGKDSDIVTLSFIVKSEAAANDLVDWFERGYDWVLDADVSPGEIKPGRFLVYIELRRRSQAGAHLADAIDDFNTLTEYQPADWVMIYDRKEMPFSREEFDRVVPLSPKQYRKVKESDLNEMRAAAGIEPKQVFEREQDIRQLQAAAGQI